MTNYVRHLNAFFSLVRGDKRLTSSHVSLYMALFQYWNFNRFQNPFPVYRHNLMQLSKIGSKSTYHKCIRELHGAQYIVYHPSFNKFQPVKISVVRLDEDDLNRYKQLDIFQNGPERCDAKKSTGRVPELAPQDTDFGTDTVLNSVHLLKQTGKQKNGVGHTPTKIFEKNRQWNRRINALAGGTNGGHIPLLADVIQFFQQEHCSEKEAQKFYYYNQGKSWMLTDRIPITDWRALARKWMLNPRKPDEAQPGNSTRIQLDQAIQYLYERYIEGGKINKLLAPEHADYLKLELTESIKQDAFQRRLNQLSGSNEASENQLRQAYMAGQWESRIVMKDHTNLTTLAKKLAVLTYFQQAKTEGLTQIFSNSTKNPVHEH